MTKLLIFGVQAECARIVFEAERGGAYEVVGFVANEKELCREFMGRPVFQSEEVRTLFRRTEVSAFACGSNRYLNQDRLGHYASAKRTGFRITSVVSADAALADDVKVRENVFIDAHVRILRGCTIGANAWIMSGAALSADVSVGASCWIGSLCQIEKKPNFKITARSGGKHLSVQTSPYPPGQLSPIANQLLKRPRCPYSQTRCSGR